MRPLESFRMQLVTKKTKYVIRRLEQSALLTNLGCDGAGDPVYKNSTRRLGELLCW